MNLKILIKKYKMYDLKIIKDKEIWDNFIIDSDFEFYSFVDSWQWGEFNKLEWNKVFRYWIYEKNNLLWVLCLIKVEARRWTYFFTPHGPLIKWNFFEVLKDILPKIKEIAKLEKCSFVRFNTTQKNLKENKIKMKEIWFIDSPMHVHAEDTHLLNLNTSKEDLLSKMDRKDRYLINRAIKEWVIIKNENSKKQIDTLTLMHTNHSNREDWKHTYTAFSKKYIENLYKVFWNNISTISAEYNSYIESILMTIKFWKTCVYYIAASDIISKKFSPNYLCQWEAILNAKDSWCSIYNFWWVSPDDNPNHPIAWVTKFKRKFGWYDYSLLHAQDLVITNKYWVNYLIESFRRIKRWYYYKKAE